MVETFAGSLPVRYTRFPERAVAVMFSYQGPVPIGSP